MKKIIKCIAILFAVIGLAGCTDPANGSNPKEITVDGLTINGRELGGWKENASISDNTITFMNLQDHGCGIGWNLCGLDFSEYTKVRITFERLDVYPSLSMYEQGFKNSHWWNIITADKVIEANLSGEGANYIAPDGYNFDKSQGFILALQNLQDSKVTGDVKIVVKSIEFIK